MQLANPFFAQAVIVAKDVAARDRLHAKLEQMLAEEFPERDRAASRRSSSARRSAGRSSTGSAGPTRRWCARSRSIWRRPWRPAPTRERTNFDWVEPTREVRIRIDQDQARLLGLSSEAVAGVLNTVITGTPVTQVRDDIYLVNVVARATDEQRVSLTTLPTLQIPLPNGRTVPLSQFAIVRVSPRISR